MVLVPVYVIFKFLSMRGSLWEVSSGQLSGGEMGGSILAGMREMKTEEHEGHTPQ
jgi:hypothetical protein